MLFAQRAAEDIGANIKPLPELPPEYAVVSKEFADPKAVLRGYKELILQKIKEAKA